MTFLKTVKITTLTLLLLLFTNNSYAKSDRVPKLRSLFNVDNGASVNWDNDSQSVYTSSKNEIHRYDYDSDRSYHTVLTITEDVNCIVPIISDRNIFAIAVKRRIDILEWDGISLISKIEKTLFEIETTETDKDDIKIFTADNVGRFYGATGIENGIGDGTGCLYKWEVSEQMPPPTKLFCDITEIGGITWDFKRGKLYLIDKLKYRIDEYDYVENTGDISNPKILYDFGPDLRFPGFYPYGIAIDKIGSVFVSALNDFQVLKLDPIKKIIEQKIQVPCKDPISLGFGGPMLDTLFVGTTNKWQKYPCGDIVEITCLETTGLLNNKLKITGVGK